MWQATVTDCVVVRGGYRDISLVVYGERFQDPRPEVEREMAAPYHLGLQDPPGVLPLPRTGVSGVLTLQPNPSGESVCANPPPPLACTYQTHTQPSGCHS